MGPVGIQELIVIFLVALVLFGPKKLPELGKTIAKAVSEFRRAQSDFKATLDREMQALERENESLKEVTRQAAPLGDGQAPPPRALPCLPGRPVKRATVPLERRLPRRLAPWSRSDVS